MELKELAEWEDRLNCLIVELESALDSARAASQAVDDVWAAFDEVKAAIADIPEPGEVTA
jgi:hypothetical protein